MPEPVANQSSAAVPPATGVEKSTIDLAPPVAEQAAPAVTLPVSTPQPVPTLYESVKHQQEAPVAQRRVLAEDLQWNLSPVKKLSDLCINVLVSRFEAPLVPDEEYWQRKSVVTFKLCNVRDHGGSWKRLFFESNVQKILEDFVPQYGGEQEMDLMTQLDLGAPYINKLQVRQLRPTDYDARKTEKEGGTGAGSLHGRSSHKFTSGNGDGVHPDHLNLGMVFSKLKNLEELDICYSVRDCGIEFQWEYFGMTMNDCVYLSDVLKSNRVLRSLTVAASGIDDDRCHLIANALMENRTLKNLDLSHNLIGDAGARAIATVFTNPSSPLTHITLANNKIGQTGGTFLATALLRNPKLVQLSLRMNFLGDKGGSAIFTALRENTTLQQLDLSCNQLGPTTVAAMCTTLKLNTRVPASLDMSCNKLGHGDVAKDLLRSTTVEAGKPQGPPKLAAVEDGREASEDAAGKAIFDAVSQNKYLTHLDLRMTGVSQEFQQAIQGIVNENKSGL
ncbi:hypothetical protein PhCBS80983_g00814 [Powellomyces hirtus]|uniref:Uncharacterized protein n=1 Tax=Powellomyces hirtus TaxID=109895 RepID=A0A507EDQ3_9FUNG|nr:hypothetical protein PhCBS80983_g00814 [Powellomyces hirtus]